MGVPLCRQHLGGSTVQEETQKGGLWQGLGRRVRGRSRSPATGLKKESPGAESQNQAAAKVETAETILEPLSVFPPIKAHEGVPPPPPSPIVREEEQSEGVGNFQGVVRLKLRSKWYLLFVEGCAEGTSEVRATSVPEKISFVLDSRRVNWKPPMTASGKLRQGFLEEVLLFPPTELEALGVHVNLVILPGDTWKKLRGSWHKKSIAPGSGEPIEILDGDLEALRQPGCGLIPEHAWGRLDRLGAVEEEEDEADAITERMKKHWDRLDKSASPRRGRSRSPAEKRTSISPKPYREREFFADVAIQWQPALVSEVEEVVAACGVCWRNGVACAR